MLYGRLFFPLKPTARWVLRTDPLHTEERAVGFKGKNEFIIQLYEQFFLCVDLFLSILSGIISMLL